jgi:hypothetical protein
VGEEFGGEACGGEVGYCLEVVVVLVFVIFMRGDIGVEMSR